MGGKVPIENFTSMTEELDLGRRVNRQEKIAAEKKKWTWACDQLKLITG